MHIITKIIPVFLIIVMVSACDINISNRSGTLKDDYIAEPLSDRSKKYESALNTSNKILEKLILQDYDTIHSNLFDRELQGTLKKDQFRTLMARVESHYGKAKNYKKMQWSFFSGKDDRDKLLYSKKIVEHEKGMVKYLFVFVDDGKYKKIIGLSVKERKGVTRAGVF